MLSAEASAKTLRWEKAIVGRACGKGRAKGDEFGEVGPYRP